MKIIPIFPVFRPGFLFCTTFLTEDSLQTSRIILNGIINIKKKENNASRDQRDSWKENSYSRRSHIQTTNK